MYLGIRWIPLILVDIGPYHNRLYNPSFINTKDTASQLKITPMRRSFQNIIVHTSVEGEVCVLCIILSFCCS